MKKALLLLSITFAVFASYAQLHTFRNYNHRDGLTMTSLLDIKQDKDGMLWIGTDGAGFISFDGDNFNEFVNDQSDISHHISNFFIKDHKFIFASKYKGIFESSKKDDPHLLYKDSSSLEYNGVYPIGNDLLILRDVAIQVYSNGQAKTVWNRSNDNEILYVSKIIDTPLKTIILSNLTKLVIDKKTHQAQTLSQWLNIPQEKSKLYTQGYFYDGNLYLTDNYLSNWSQIIFSKKNEVFKISYHNNESNVLTSPVLHSTLNRAANCYAVLTKDGGIYEIRNSAVKKIAHNYPKALNNCQSICADLNGDYWITSNTSGLFKVSLEPFTKVQFHEVYNSSQIHFPYRSNTGDIFISTVKETFIGNIYTNIPFSTFNITVSGAVEDDQNVYLACYEGLYIFNKQTRTLSPKNFQNQILSQQCTSIFLDENKLWVGIASKGLVRVDLSTGQSEHFDVKDNVQGGYIYTAQATLDEATIYFGGNAGITRYDKKSGIFTHIKMEHLGSYCGLSIKDVHGTIWFTLEKGLVGITRRNKIVELDNPEYFSSFLFYTLNSDNYGNLLIGTNKGIKLIKVNDEGKVIDQRDFPPGTGFGGYETHMRSQFQRDNLTFVGTIEGLYQINSDVIESLTAPNIPVIERINNFSERDQSFTFQFKVNNAKVKSLKYSYRIPQVSKKWSELTDVTTLNLPDLSGGDYQLEVRATYNGHAYSDIARYDFNVNVPFYMSKTFIAIILLLVILINVIILIRMRSIGDTNIFHSEDAMIIYDMAPSIILFGLIANLLSHSIAPYLSVGFDALVVPVIVVSAILAVIYFLSLNNKFNRNVRGVRFNLISAFFIILGTNLYGAYVSDLHPFYTLAIVIVNSVGPFIFDRFKHSLFYVLAFIIANGILLIALGETHYSKSLFIIAVVVTSLLVVFMTYVRFDSINKLTFISGVINQGNIPTLAFNSKGKITYVSENISKYIPITSQDLLSKNISTLNQFVPENQEQHDVNLTEQFEDGKSYVVPMISEMNEVNYIEWSCKVFSKDVRVILGQDITDKIELENTYERLVQNAEDLIYQVDINGIFRFVNDRFFDRMGYSKGELVGTSSLDLIPESHIQEVYNYYRSHFMENKKISFHEFPIKKKNGDIIWIGQYVTSLYLPGTEDFMTGFLALARDITEKREHQAIIETQSSDIKSSITYAKRIQYNLLPQKEDFDESFNEFFTLFKPKDIVSGDFYWLEHIGHYSILTVGDCTGHGVPGAFMSLLGINLLNNIVHEKQILNPGKMMDDLDIRLRAALPREIDGNVVNDGMEVTICVFNHKDNTVSYACAGSRFLLHDGTSFNLFKGDNKHIGDERPDGFTGYITHHTTFDEGSTAYFFSDGYQDQFGGRKNKKYSFRRMIELFEENLRLPLNEQHHMFMEEFTKWKGEEFQTDDVTIVGIRGIKKYIKDE